MWNGPVYDCQLCGACCSDPNSHGDGVYVFLYQNEARRIRRLGLTVLQSSGGDSYLGLRLRPGSAGHPVCVAFEGRIGARCGCSIYAARPQNCRTFQAGSKECLEAREAVGLPI